MFLARPHSPETAEMGRVWHIFPTVHGRRYSRGARLCRIGCDIASDQIFPRSRMCACEGRHIIIASAGSSFLLVVSLFVHFVGKRVADNHREGLAVGSDADDLFTNFKRTLAAEPVLQ